VPGGFTSPYSPTPITPVFANPMTRATPDAPHCESREVFEYMKSEDISSTHSWRRDTNHPLSKLRKPPRNISPPRLQLLQDKMAKAAHVEDTAPLSSGQSGRKLFLSHGPNDSEESETRVCQRGTMQSKHRELALDSVKSSSPDLRSFRRTTSQAGDSTSLKEEEIVERSLLMAQDKGKHKRGSQEPSSESGNDDSVVLLTAEQKLHRRSSRVCEDHGIKSPCTQQRIYLQACEEAVASMRVLGPRKPDEEDERFEDHFMGTLALLMSVQLGSQGTSPPTLPPKSPHRDSTHRMSKEDAVMPATTSVGIMTQMQNMHPAVPHTMEDFSRGMLTSSINIIVPSEVRQLPGLPTIMENPNIAGAIAGLAAP